MEGFFIATYDYKCKKCGKIFEVEHKMNDIAMKFCPSCGGELKKVYNAVGVVFKGSGFHVTDYGKSGSSGTKSSGSSETKSSKS
jgi:putative FmdB family regulatory protein